MLSETAGTVVFGILCIIFIFMVVGMIYDVYVFKPKHKYNPWNDPLVNRANLRRGLKRKRKHTSEDT